MKKTMSALAVLSTLFTAAQAQSNVSMYGLLDQALVYTSNVNAAKDSLVSMKSGGMNTSRFGFRGTEDLGSDLKAVFQLESGIRIDTGTQDDSTALFNRQANVGLQGKFGRVIVGRSFSTTYDFLLPFDPMGYAPVYSWAISSNASAPVAGGAVRKDGMLTGVSNLIKYQGDFGPFKIGATYGLGEEAGSTSGSAKYDVAAAYTYGQFAVAGSYDRQNGATTAAGAKDRTDMGHVGLSYTFSDVKLFAAYRDYKKTFASGVAELRSNMVWGGVSYQATPALALTGAVYHQDIQHVAQAAQADPTMYVGRAKYALSSRTDLYAIFAYAKAQHDLAVSVSRDDPGFGATQSGLALGMQHRF